MEWLCTNTEHPSTAEISQQTKVTGALIEREGRGFTGHTQIKADEETLHLLSIEDAEVHRRVRLDAPHEPARRLGERGAQVFHGRHEVARDGPSRQGLHAHRGRGFFLRGGGKKSRVSSGGKWVHNRGKTAGSSRPTTLTLSKGRHTGVGEQTKTERSACQLHQPHFRIRTTGSRRPDVSRFQHYRF